MEWAALLALSILCAALLEAVRLPAALLLGPMVAAIALARPEGRIRVPNRLFVIAQSLIGCMIARSLPVAILGEILHHGPLLLGGVLSVIAASGGLGWLLARWRVLPGTTAIWGASPGAATAMVLMAEAYGADVRLVAFMQYLRVVFVAAVASGVARLWTSGSGGALPQMVWFPPVAWLPFAGTLALAVLGEPVARLLRIPAGPLLLPLAVGIVVQNTGLMTIELPPWLLAASYALVGWSIGLRFTRSILIYAARSLPRVVAAIIVLIAAAAAWPRSWSSRRGSIR